MDSRREIAEGEILELTSGREWLVRLSSGEVVTAVFSRSRRSGCLFGSLIGWKVRVVVHRPPRRSKIIEILAREDSK